MNPLKFGFGNPCFSMVSLSYPQDLFAPHKLKIMCNGYRFNLVERLFKWIGKCVGDIFENSIQMCETHIVERLPYLLMRYTSPFVCIVMLMHMHVN
jgi:hypothetical protein